MSDSSLGAKPICIHCGADRQIELEAPGVITYEPCGVCGAVGIRWNTDTWLRRGRVLQERESADPLVETRRKKSFRLAYENR